MKHPATHRSPTGASPPGWLPPSAVAAPSPARPLEHWLSRAARGHTWNAGASTRRRTH
jgi:hypothetical protein